MLEVSCWSTVYLQPTSTLFNCNIFNFISNSPWRMRELKPWKARGKHKSASAYDGGGGGGTEDEVEGWRERCWAVPGKPSASPRPRQVSTRGGDIPYFHSS